MSVMGIAFLGAKLNCVSIADVKVQNQTVAVVQHLLFVCKFAEQLQTYGQLVPSNRLQNRR